MAKSFAEAFKVAQARKASMAKPSIPVVTSPVPPSPQPHGHDQNLWVQETATIKSFGARKNEDLTIAKVTGVPPTPVPAVSTARGESLFTKKSGSGSQSDSKPKKARNANLEEYRQRMALVKAAHARANHAALHYPDLLHARGAAVPLPEAQEASVTLTIEAGAQVVWDGRSSSHAPFLKNDPELGMRSQLSSEPKSAREVVLGFDFGTSSAKVVIGDRDLKKAHAVPFRDAVGIEAYLLPARLYEANGSYSLHTGTQSFDDLKLALLANPDDLRLQCRVVAYLALVIRESRAWLFTAHADDYARTQILWTLALGLPAERVVGNSLTDIFRRLGTAAWFLAGDQLIISPDACEKALTEATVISEDNAVEVTVTPEIAAQVYGFVNSHSFDDKARNFFLIADVGAGTVDTCLFRVARAKGGRWSFEICTTSVEPGGVMNLHRHRVSWWHHHLALTGAGAHLCKDLENIKLSTENQIAIPASYDAYLKGVKAQFTGKAVDPDSEFFRVPVLRQVQGRTLYRAFSGRLMSKEDIADIPFLLCGGGTRLGFYQKLRSALSRFEGCSWLRTRSQQLVVPEELRVSGVGRSDYDRLSVAYGLSMLNLATLSTMPQLPRMAEQPQSEQWRCHYVDKDQC